MYQVGLGSRKGQVLVYMLKSIYEVYLISGNVEYKVVMLDCLSKEKHYVNKKTRSHILASQNRWYQLGLDHLTTLPNFLLIQMILYLSFSKRQIFSSLELSRFVMYLFIKLIFVRNNIKLVVIFLFDIRANVLTQLFHCYIILDCQ